MTWIRIDDALMENDKIRRAGKDATLLYLAGLCYCGKKLTDGFIPDYDLPIVIAWARIDNSEQTIQALLAHPDGQNGLWERVPNGYTVHDYLVYNPTREQVVERRRKRAEAGKQGGYESSRVRTAAKAQREREAHGEALASANAQANGEPNDEAPANPVSPGPGPRTPGPAPESALVSAAALTVAEEPPPRGKRAQSAKQREQNRIRRALREHFTFRSGLSPPSVTSDGRRREVGRLWWAPLREIAELAGWDIDTGQALIDEALRRLEELTVSDPNSILKTARAVAAEGVGALGGAEQLARHIERIKADMAQMGGGP